MKPWKKNEKKKEQKPNIATQSKKVFKKKNLRSKTDLSKSSKY